MAPQFGQNLLVIPICPQFRQVHSEGWSGFFAPRSGQNLLAIFFHPRAEQSQICGGSGFFSPQSGQNLEVIFLQPHDGQSHPWADSGFFAPHSGQHFVDRFIAPQEQFQVFPALSLAAAMLPPISLPTALAVFKTGLSASLVIFITPPIAPSVTPRLAKSPRFPPTLLEEFPVMPFCIASKPT